ncbi:hypothetical protein K501DRAFT_283352 [Backusella circina FSU 941]|nr:hypothetical protein K501DRAFT_283352 [Backusella circina FSU 941]
MEEDEIGLQREHMSGSYNPSTVGIPPSSFLSPPQPQQASIRSEYTPPPPAYRDLRYPPSYHSTQSTKDDVSVY